LRGGFAAAPRAIDRRCHRRQCKLMTVRLSGQNYFAASGLMLAYFAPGGTPADVLDAYKHVYPAWMRQLTDRNLEGIWKTCRGHPHSAYCYGWTGFLDIYCATSDRRLLDAMLGGWELYHRHWLHPGGTLAICEGDLAYPPDSLFITPHAHTGETCSMVWWAEFNHKLHLLFPSRHTIGTAKNFCDDMRANCVRGVPTATFRKQRRIQSRRRMPSACPLRCLQSRPFSLVAETIFRVVAELCGSRVELR